MLEKDKKEKRTDDYVISVNDVCKHFKDRTALNHVSLHCKPGKIYGIVGYNGSGKTVLFKCICGFFHVDSGEIRINGKLMGKDVDMLNNAGIIIEEPGYLRNLSGYKNLENLYCLRNKKNKDYLYQVMEQVGLDPHEKKHVCHYSLGMRQRLAIAQAIMEDPEILILDEPMNGLDRNGIDEMRKIFRGLRNDGKTILLASHNREDIDVLCDEVYEMENGILESIGRRETYGDF